MKRERELAAKRAAGPADEEVLELNSDGTFDTSSATAAVIPPCAEAAAEKDGEIKDDGEEEEDKTPPRKFGFLRAFILLH